MIALYVRLGTEQTARFTFDKQVLRIGSGQDNQLALCDRSVALHHVQLSISDAESNEWCVEANAETFVDGVRLALRQPVAVRDGAKLVVGNFVVVLALAEPALSREPTEAILLAEILGGDRASREVYADWLDERGREARAEFVRLQAVLDERPSHDTVRAALVRSYELAQLPDVEYAWRRRVGRPPIANCGHDHCPRDWGALASTGRPDTRNCGTCRERVRYCPTHFDGRRAGGRVVIDFAALHELASVK